MKKTLCSAIFLLSLEIGLSQTFMHGLGIVTVIQSAPGYLSSTTVGFTYSPKVNFSMTDHSSLSVGMPFSFTFSASQQSIVNYFTASLPLLVNFNYGAGSSKKNAAPVGFFAGAGFGYHLRITDDKVYYTGNPNYNGDIEGLGPVANAGIRIATGSRGHDIEIKFSFMKTLDVSKSNVSTIGVLFNF